MPRYIDKLSTEENLEDWTIENSTFKHCLRDNDELYEKVLENDLINLCN